MIKKLDKLILKSFTGPFIATFFIAFFVLTMQTLWKYIDDLVGKGLDFFTIMQFVWYASATLSSLAMPIAILISSIMTFGNLGESFELVAIKASGISLLRFMRPLIFVSAGLCIITFLFSNYVIPYSNFKFYTLYKEILVKKPAFDLQEGVFYNQIPGYSIRTEKKEQDGTILKNVLIYEGSNPLQDNTISAASGKMSVSADKNFLEFNLKNGTRYQERGGYGDTMTEYVRLHFTDFKKLFDISVLQQQSATDSNLRNNNRMLSAGQLSRNLDSVKKLRTDSKERLTIVLDSALPRQKSVASPSTVKISYPDSLQALLMERTISVASGIKNNLAMSSAEVSSRDNEIKGLKIEWHRKFSFSLACLVLFFIGAPLGSIIRKGGLGLPLVVAIVFFLLFHLLGMFGEKFAKTGKFTPLEGMWFSVACLIPVGIFFTYKAMHDSQLFSKEFYSRNLNRLKSVFISKKENIQA